MKRGKNPIIFAASVGVAAIGAAVGFRFFALVPREWHAALFGASVALVTLETVVATQLLTKLDRLLLDAEGYDATRVKNIYAYVHQVRQRIVILLLAAGFVGVMNAGLAILIPKAASDAIIRGETTAGYAALLYLLWFGFNVAKLYLDVDFFRRDLFSLLKEERQRIATLLEMRGNTIESFAPRDTPRSAHPSIR